MITITGSGMRVAVADGAGANADGKKSAEEISRMTPAERLDYARQFRQDQMPEWRDPRVK